MTSCSSQMDAPLPLREASQVLLGPEPIARSPARVMTVRHALTQFWCNEAGFRESYVCRRCRIALAIVTDRFMMTVAPPRATRVLQPDTVYAAEERLCSRLPHDVWEAVLSLALCSLA